MLIDLTQDPKTHINSTPTNLYNCMNAATHILNQTSLPRRCLGRQTGPTFHTNSMTAKFAAMNAIDIIPISSTPDGFIHAPVFTCLTRHAAPRIIDPLQLISNIANDLTIQETQIFLRLLKQSVLTTCVSSEHLATALHNICQRILKHCTDNPDEVKIICNPTTYKLIQADYEYSSISTTILPQAVFNENRIYVLPTPWTLGGFANPDIAQYPYGNRIDFTETIGMTIFDIGVAAGIDLF